MLKVVITQTLKTAQCYVEELGNGIGLEMVLIPGDRFIMEQLMLSFIPGKIIL